MLRASLLSSAQQEFYQAQLAQFGIEKTAQLKILTAQQAQLRKNSVRLS